LSKVGTDYIKSTTPPIASYDHVILFLGLNYPFSSLERIRKKKN